ARATLHAPPRARPRGRAGAARRAVRPRGAASVLALRLPRAHRLALPWLRPDPRPGWAGAPPAGVRLPVQSPGRGGGLSLGGRGGGGAGPVGVPAALARAPAVAVGRPELPGRAGGGGGGELCVRHRPDPHRLAMIAAGLVLLGYLSGSIPFGLL